MLRQVTSVRIVSVYWAQIFHDIGKWKKNPLWIKLFDAMTTASGMISHDAFRMCSLKGKCLHNALKMQEKWNN